MEEEQIISGEGYEKLTKEFEELIKVKRPQIAHRIELAKELGDLSENSEYHDAKEAQAFNEGRVAELSTLIKNLKVVENGNSTNTIGMGNIVLVKSKNIEKKYKIVSFNEADPLEGKISNESPLGKAFVGRKVGDKVIVQAPNGSVEYQILKIS